MKIDYSFDDIVGFSKLKATAEEYDGTPAPSTLQYEFISPRPSNNNVVAAAGVLAFGEFIEGKVTVAGPVDRPVAQSLQDFLGQAHVHFSDMDFRPKDPNRRPNIAALNIAETKTTELEVVNSFDQDREFILTLHDATSRVGWSMDLPRIDIPSNAGLLARGREPFTASWWGPYLAVSIMIAEAFQIGTIRLPKFVGTREAVLRNVLRALDMRLEISEGSRETQSRVDARGLA